MDRVDENKNEKYEAEQIALLNGINAKAVIVKDIGKFDDKPLGLRAKAVRRQVLMVVLGNLSVVSGGMALGFPAVTLDQLRDPNEPVSLTASEASWFASINAIACPLGGLLSGYLLDKIGRKKTIYTINFTACLSWALLTTAYSTHSTWFFIQIMMARFIIGITTGLSSSPIGVYSAETCHPALRGRLTLGTSIATAVGIFLIYTLGFFIRNDFRLISGIGCGYAIIATVLTVFLPESPSWLMSKNRIEEAKDSLKYFRGLERDDNQYYDDFEDEFIKLQKSSTYSDGNKKQNIWRSLQKPEAYKPLLIMIGFFACQQFSGIFVVIVYAVQFSKEAGVQIDEILCAMFVGLTRILTTFLVGILLDNWGRRPPAMLSGLGMGLSMFLLAFSVWFPNTIGMVPYLPVICIVGFIFTSTLGLMTLPFSMISEVYPLRVRGPAAGITICFGYLMSFTTIKTYDTMVSEMGKENVFAFYGTISLIAVVYIYFFLPETKGKTLADIEEYFRTGGTSDAGGLIWKSETVIKIKKKNSFVIP